MIKETLDTSRELWDSQTKEQKLELFDMMINRYKNMLLQYMSDFSDHIDDVPKNERTADLIILFTEEWLYNNFKFMLK